MKKIQMATIWSVFFSISCFYFVVFKYFNCACAGAGEVGYIKACDKEEEEEQKCNASYVQMLVVSFFTIFFEFLTDVTAPMAILR